MSSHTSCATQEATRRTADAFQGGDNRLSESNEQGVRTCCEHLEGDGFPQYVGSPRWVVGVPYHGVEIIARHGSCRDGSDTDSVVITRFAGRLFHRGGE